MFKDLVRVTDHAVTTLRSKVGGVIAGRAMPDPYKSVVQIEGWVSLVMRERGKIVPGTRREGKNVWTNSGREHLPLLMSYQAVGTPFRNDRMAYIGVGTGAYVEDAGVIRLANPIEYIPGTFLAPLDIPPTFPLTPTRTTVRYHRIFAESEITTVPGQVNISEMGMFTDGNPASSYSPGSRDVTIANAASQAPNSYKSFEPVGKTSSLELEVSWEIRF